MKNDISKLMIVQPYITNYRVVVFNKISEQYNVFLCASEESSYGNVVTDNTKSFEYMVLKEHTFLGSRVFWQSGLLFAFLKYRPNTLFITANPRYLSSWVLLLISKVLGKKIFLHGQGLYKKTKVTIFNKIIFNLYNYLSTSYICYTDSSKESLRELPIYKKSEVAENSIVNEFSIQKEDADQNGILFVGRLRDGSNIELLINSVSHLNQHRAVEKKLFLHIIGGGEMLETYKEKYKQDDWVVFYGEIYDSCTISEISKNCVIGCYPGDAGLSVLHYMSLSLPAVIHSNLPKHMGPEASYVINNYNGTLFEKDSIASLQQVIESVVNNKKTLIKMQKNAYQTYLDISQPDLASRIIKIISKAE